MTDREMLLRAICADPDDDTVRLAYADWLEENNESEHATFLRTQIEVPVQTVWCPCPTLSADYSAWRITDLELFDRRGRNRNSFPGASVRYRRGLVDTASVLSTDFHRLYRRAFVTYPLTDVYFSDVPVDYVDDPRHNNYHVRLRASALDDFYEVVRGTNTLWSVFNATYPTVEACTTAASRALVDWGRLRAGLPALSRKEV